jgi:hypothetical protein
MANRSLRSYVIQCKPSKTPNLPCLRNSGATHLEQRGSWACACRFALPGGAKWDSAEAQALVEALKGG